jgi:hypothetical protein
MAAMLTGDPRVRKRTILPALVLATAGMLVAAQSSFGQAAVEQYIPDINPTGQHKSASGGGNGGGTGSSGTATVSPSTASGGTGSSASGTSGNRDNGSGGSAGNAQKKAADTTVAGLSSFQDPGGGGGSASGGNAPGTDFPVTTFVLLVVGIFLAGLLVYAFLRKRRPRGALR